MDKQAALNALGLSEGASAEAIGAALAAKRQDLAGKKASAPTDALKAKFAALEAKLAEVEQALAGSLPNPAPSRPSLSQTKLADLPGLAPQDAAQVELQPGQTLANRYEIKELIGQGGMGAVYRAFDKNRDEDIAIKVLLPSLTKNERALQRFLNEARISSKLSHQHIVNVYDVQSDGDLYFLIMELLEGQDLAHLIQTREQLNQPFTAKELVEVIEQLAPALDYAHQHTVHRDIKPENIWLDEDGHYKLMDFGIAQLQSTSQRTQTGAAMGTAYYMAPEQLKGSKNIDAKADIYALGVMLYAMATGDVPAGLIKPLADKRPDISPAFSNAVMQCLEADPADRPQSAGALLGLLQKGLMAKGGKITKGSTTKSTAAHLSSGPNKWVVAAVLLILVGVGGAVGTGAIDLSGLMPMSAEERAQKEASIARIQGEIKVIKQRLETGRRNLDSDVRDAERNKSSNLNALQHWQTLTENSIFNGSQLGDLEGTQSMAETLLRKEQYAPSEQAFIEVKAGYKKLNAEFQAGEKLHEADQSAQKAKNEWLAFAKQYSFTGQSPSAEQAQQTYDEAKQQSRSGELATSLSLFQQAQQQWRSAPRDEAVVAQVGKQEAAWAEAERQREAAAAAAERQRIAGIVGALQRSLKDIPGRNFRMQEHEVTFAQWDACVSAGGCSHKPNDNGGGRGNRPVMNVSWNDVTQQFIPWLNKVTGQRFRLPSQAEWMYAARAGSMTEYAWGDSISCSRARYGRREGGECSNSWDGTAPVRSFAPNQWGLYDMHGNISEWTQSCGPGNCDERILQGGAWNEEPVRLRLSSFARTSVSTRFPAYGFRLVQDR